MFTVGPISYGAEFKCSVTATEFIGDGSKLTNLPTGGNVDLDEYARLDGAEFTGPVSSASVRSNYFCTDDEHKVEIGPHYGNGKASICSFNADGTRTNWELGLDRRGGAAQLWLNDNTKSGADTQTFLVNGEKGLEVGPVTDGAEFKCPVTATEFIGDGSKLTNLPTGGNVDLDDYARLDGADFTGEVTITGAKRDTCLRLRNDAIYDLPTWEELIDTAALVVTSNENNRPNALIAGSGHSVPFCRN